ncbi:MAG: MerR family transcriptional regulator [Coprococcus sp.]
MKKKDTFKIGELSKLFDIGVDSIRYYEKVGILHPVRNDENNYRMYTIDDVRRLALIRIAGLSFPQTRSVNMTDRNVDSTTSLLRAELDVVDAEIAKLKATRDSIDRLDTITSFAADIQDEFETIVIKGFQTESASWSRRQSS